MSRKKLFLFVILLFFMCPLIAQVDSMATISGFVNDARTKQPLIEAVVSLSSNVFEGHRLAVTDSSGKYRIRNLPAGLYRITFEMEGYEKFTQEDIALRKAMSLGVSFQMIRERKETGKRD